MLPPPWMGLDLLSTFVLTLYIFVVFFRGRSGLHCWRRRVEVASAPNFACGVGPLQDAPAGAILWARAGSHVGRALVYHLLGGLYGDVPSDVINVYQPPGTDIYVTFKSPLMRLRFTCGWHKNYRQFNWSPHKYFKNFPNLQICVHNMCHGKINLKNLLS